MTPHPCRAVIFDLDGVVTRTALVHSAAWKRMFDQVLRERAEQHGESFRPFTHEGDYLPYVDGRPRYEGVAAFLGSRGIELSWGDPEDPPGTGTICAVGNRKNAAFHDILDRDGVRPYETTVALIHTLRDAGVRVGIASSSRNARPVLAAAGLLPLMETVVDGVTSVERGLAGKPAPDIFVAAAADLGAPPDQCVVIEDAVSGVSAGAAGGFGLVVGVAREDNTEQLWAAGADLVVSDLAELDLDGLREWFVRGLHEDGWTLTFRGFDPAVEGHREALLTVGNGYLGTRGAAEERDADGTHYPATYVAGVYDRATSRVGDRDVDNEDLVNAINWLPTRVRVVGGSWLGPDHPGLLSSRRTLDLRTGVLTRELRVRTQGREIHLESLRLASMDERHQLALRTRVTAVGTPARIEVEMGLDGDLLNDGVARYRSLERRHLEPISAGGRSDRLELVSRTRDSGIQVATAAQLDVKIDGSSADPGWADGGTGEGRSRRRCVFELAADRSARLDKRVSIHTSRGCVVPLERANATLDTAPSVDRMLADSARRWAELWDRMDVQVDGDRLAQKLMRLHLYHLLVS
ncbi:MAG: beta-phosphoglucomutase family hydrolase, partial [Myxococcota bacterium]|nr:beta-phosphoglucomutase family hydrolase [Myxococcota bacterium]